MKKTLECVDCRVAFTYEHLKGPTRQRCDACTASRKQQTDNAKSKRWRDANPEKQAAVSRRHHEKRKQAPGWREYKNQAEMVRKYGITMPQFNILLEAQGGKCAVCGGDRNGPGVRLHVDHCHTSGRVRGLLCGKCNTAIGLLNDDPALADALAVYLRLE